MLLFDSYSLDTGWVTTDTNIHLPDSSSLWSSSGSYLDGKNSVTLSWSNDQNMIFEKTISLDENYLFQVEQKIINKSELMFEAFPYGLSKRKGEPEMQEFFILHEGPMSVTDSVLKEYSYEDLREDKKIKFSTPAFNFDEVFEIPKGATLLASDNINKIMGIYFKSGNSEIWGLQYHPDYEYSQMLNLSNERKDRMIANKNFKDENDFQNHMNFIKDENKKLDFENRTCEVRNWLDIIKLDS